MQMIMINPQIQIAITQCYADRKKGRKKLAG